VLIEDEATCALTAADVGRALEVIKTLRDEGLALLYISPRMQKIEAHADAGTVLRGGSDIATFKAGDTTDTENTKMMISREYRNAVSPKLSGPRPTAPPVIEWRGLSWTNRLHDISLSVRPAEVVGLSGLDAQGRRDLLPGMFGVLRGVSGDILIDGKPTRIASPRDAKSSDIDMALIPEDRKTEGLMLEMSVQENLSFAALDRLSAGGLIDRALEREEIDKAMSPLAIRADRASGAVRAPSGRCRAARSRRL
jgi:ribose transport system ATP-binding protein